MVGAVLAGDGLERVAEIASSHAGAPVAVIVPRLGAPVDGWKDFERYVGARLAGGRPQRPAEIKLEVPISSGGRDLGAVLMLGRGCPEAPEYLHMAAIAALTEVAVVEARDETEQSLRGSFLEEALTRTDLDPADAERRAARLGCDLTGGFTALCGDPGGRSPGPPGGRAGRRGAGRAGAAGGRQGLRLLPGEPELARRVATRRGPPRHGGDVVALLVGGRPDPGARGGGAGARRDRRPAAARRWRRSAGHLRLLFRVMASHPQEVRSFYEDTVSALVRYDEQYATDLLGTLDAYLENNCNMNATAQAIHAHRHTVGYRLERVKELTGLDPLRSEDRERLGLGLKAYRIIAALTAPLRRNPTGHARVAGAPGRGEAGASAAAATAPLKPLVAIYPKCRARATPLPAPARTASRGGRPGSARSPPVSRTRPARGRGRAPISSGCSPAPARNRRVRVAAWSTGPTPGDFARVGQRPAAAPLPHVEVEGPGSAAPGRRRAAARRRSHHVVGHEAGVGLGLLDRRAGRGVVRGARCSARSPPRAPAGPAR